MKKELFIFTTDKKGKSHKKSGLLVDFIYQKLEDHKEPERKGTPRGYKIGFPIKKHAACLLVALTNYKLKQIAETTGKALGFSYNLLRKWNSETEFRAQQDEFRSEFAITIYKYIKSEYLKFWEVDRDYLEAKSDQKAAHDIIEKLRRDAMSYNEHLLVKLLEINIIDLKKILELSKSDKISYLSDLMYILLLSLAVSNLAAHGLKYKIVSNKDLLERLLNFMISTSMELLSLKQDLSHREKQLILMCFGSMQEYLKLKQG
jgi:hypothetical protein